MFLDRKKPIFYCLWLLNILIAISVFLLIVQLAIEPHEGRIRLFFFSLKPRRVTGILAAIFMLSYFRILFALPRNEAILLLCSTIFSFFLGELALQYFKPSISDPKLRQWMKAHPVLGWELVPGMQGRGRLGVKVEINSHGLRDSERTWEKPKNLTRFLALGDSFTYGYGMKLSGTFVKQFENLLLEAGHNIDVINAGVTGYNLYQILTYFQTSGQKYKPDHVLYFCYYDDASSPIGNEEIQSTYEKIRRSLENTSHGFNLRLVNLYRNLRVLLNIRFRSRSEASWLHSIDERRSYLRNAYTRLQNREFQEAFFFNLSSLQKESKIIGANLHVVFIPDSAQLNRDELKSFEKKLKAFAYFHNISFLNISPIFEKEMDIASLYLFPNDAHTSEKGNRIIAQAIFQYFQSIDPGLKSVNRHSKF
jgi:lysophospholipase L1-like esterase